MTPRLLLGIGYSLVAMSAWAHEGALDSYGCHPNVAHGSYHCHKGSLSGRGYPSKAKMLDAYREHQQQERVRARAVNPPQAETPPITTR